MTPIKFSEWKPRIQAGLKNNLRGISFPGETEGFTLVDGFLNHPIQDEVGGPFVIGGPSIPMIAIVGNKTGRMYYYALKAIVPNINFEETKK